MTLGVQIMAFEGGALRELPMEESSHEAVLALPFCRLIVKMIRVPSENANDLVGYAKPILQAMCPYPDEELTVSCEVMRETGAGTLVLAAALVESTADDICEALDAKKLNITRVDALELGIVRGLWSSVAQDDARRILIVKGVDGLSLLVMDGDLPCAVRALSSAGELPREVMLSLLEAEDFDGAKELAEIICVGDLGLDEIADLAPVRRVEIGEDAGLAGVQARSNEAGTLNALPASWKEVLEEARLKAKLLKGLSIAGGIWALLMAILFGVPVVYGMMTNHQKTLSAEHKAKYEEVKSKQDDVGFVRKYSDHSRGALEVMKAVNDSLPEGVTLTRWSFSRVGGVEVSCEGDTKDGILAFQDNIEKSYYKDLLMGGVEKRLFEVVKVGAVTSRKNNLWQTDLKCAYEAEEGGR